MFTRYLLTRLFDRSIDHLKMFINIQINQYFYAGESDIPLMADSHPLVSRNTDSCQQTYCIVELIDRVSKAEINLYDGVIPRLLTRDTNCESVF